MYNNIGLPTPRGSGTNGFVERNLASVRPMTSSRGDVSRGSDRVAFGRKPSEDILEHNRKRMVIVKCMELREKLEKQGLSNSEVEANVSKLQSQLKSEMNSRLLLIVSHLFSEDSLCFLILFYYFSVLIETHE